MTRKPTTKQPQKVTKAPNKPEAVCNGVTCSQFAECKRVNYEDRCVCKEGYIGDGSSCKGELKFLDYNILSQFVESDV